jgi:LacI family transcriptional regulator
MSMTRTTIPAVPRIAGEPSIRDKHAPTLLDVARRAGVSKTAVSVVMSGATSTVRVSETTRRRIMDAASELKFRPNVLAQGLNGVRLKSLGISFHGAHPDDIVAGHYSSSLLRGILVASYEAGYNVTVVQRPWNSATESAAGLRSQGIDGFVVVAPLAESEMVAGLCALNVPIVVVSTSAEEHNVPSVDVDNLLGVRLVLNHLLELGHRRIAHVYLDGSLASYDNAIRRQFFLKVLAEAGIPAQAEYLKPVLSHGDAAEAVGALLALPDPPTAIFATNDTLARHAIRALDAAGVQVPGQFSVAGFDDNPDIALLDPTLTTVHQPLKEMGAAATRLLISILEGEEARPATHWFKPELIVRRSTARPG